MLKVSKNVKIGFISVLMVSMVGVSIVATKAINDHSYAIEEITYVSLPTEETEATEATQPDLMTRRSAVMNDIDSVDKDSMPEDEYAVMRSLSVLMNSPMSKSIGSAEYEVKLIDDQWVTKFSCSEFELFVSCDNVYFSPTVYTCSRKFTEEELKYFHSLGTAWEVENEDGTYSVYYT